MRIHQEDAEILCRTVPGFKERLDGAKLKGGCYHFKAQGDGLGDRLARWFYTLGFVQKACGCAARQATLNRFGFRLAAFAKRILAKLRRAPNTGG